MEAPQATTKNAQTPVSKPAGFAPAGTRNFRPDNRDRKPFGNSRGGDNRFSRRGGRPDGRNERKDDMDTKLLDLSRVSHTRAGGRRLRFRAIVISGNKAGKVGLGIASGSDVAQAVEKATVQSKKNMLIVPVVNNTISHEVIAKVGPAQVLLKPQRKGRGLMAGGVVRLICQLAGVKDISSKMLGTTKNKLNNARATMKAFESLKKHMASAKTVAAPVALIAPAPAATAEAE